MKNQNRNKSALNQDGLFRSDNHIFACLKSNKQRFVFLKIWFRKIFSKFLTCQQFQPLWPY